MSLYLQTLDQLALSPKTWLVTGAAGFIGSNLTETLLRAKQRVIALDNFSTGKASNLEMVRESVGEAAWKNYTFLEKDIRDLAACQEACAGVDYVLHQAAIGSVPRSIADPLVSNSNNIDGFLHMLIAARDAKVKKFVYAASSSTYGDSPTLPKVEDVIGAPLSPYAVTKYVNELYAKVFATTYGLPSIGLRYFNIFGQRQSPDGAYAAVIPQWYKALLHNEAVYINGDGETSRDFCYIDNCVQANILAACTTNPEAINKVYNIAVGTRTTLNQLFEYIRQRVTAYAPQAAQASPVYRDFRVGDVKHSLADISLAQRLLGYQPSHCIEQGLDMATRWYAQHLA